MEQAGKLVSPNNFQQNLVCRDNPPGAEIVREFEKFLIVTIDTSDDSEILEAVFRATIPGYPFRIFQ